MSKALIDLLWQLKRELEHKVGLQLDLPRFIDDVLYRRQILRDTDTRLLSAGLQQILPELAVEGALDLRRQIGNTKPDAVPPSRIPDSTKTASGGRPGHGMLKGMGLIVLFLVMAIGAIQFSGNHLVSSLVVNAGSSPQPSSDRVEAPDTSTQSQDRKAAAPLTLFRLHGSNTIGESLAPALLKGFWQQQGAQRLWVQQLPTEVERDLLFDLPGSQSLQRIELKAHGSSTGFKDLLSQNTDLAMASRRIKEEERKALEPLYGDLASVRAEHVIGMDGLAIIVHPNNPIDGLNTEQLARLFAGEVDNWSQLGGPDMPVTLFSRDENSGTWDSFENLVLKKHGRTLSERARRLESSTELSDLVSQNRGAIGFIGLPYVLRAKALAIADEENAMPVYPTSFTVSTEDYPLTRRLYIYEPMTLALASRAHQFVEFVNSEEGQEIVRKSGFISQNIHRIQPVLSNQLPQNYIDLVSGGSRLSLNFRFNTGTFELDNKAQRDMERVIRFFEQNPGERVVLIGFSDNVGDPEKNQQLSLHRAEVVRDQLLARGINVVASHGLGDQAPVASNSTAAGRERNRRVEIWVRSANVQATAGAL
ncbi:hypothetical protein GCM10011352_38420 [Marinobacterium zhoushanense]|uniref:OmpA-like domain-containing protein n=1 Tax=Marinobacterium zhoushanense TaxID=1679163 RepID=A0ABQ1KRE4_9GAMM|nr:phosphate ABC transporter substrate-binding/OmpA family protein [Marinobacterium zhoushanense]GGC08429.1 hypothetical protein GCM10011352_38420 [Marinobacterium zhoushanense]